MWILVALLSCHAAPASSPDARPPPSTELPHQTPNRVQDYAKGTADLATQRQTIAREAASPTRRQRARKTLTDAIRDDLIPPWMGTEWAFYGTSETPGQGTIACGYFVSTILRDAGLEVERVKLAQQASEYIVETFAEPAQIRRFRAGDEHAVVTALLQEPEGVYAVGLDFHTGLLVHRDGQVEFCHSTFLDAAGVLCEDPRTSPAFQSNYHVFGPVLSDRVVDAWLHGHAIPTVTQ